MALDTPIITISRIGAGAVVRKPDSLVVDLVSFGVDATPGAYRLRVPAGWSYEPAGTHRWRVWPGRMSFDTPTILVLEDVVGPGRWELPVQINLDLRSSFNARTHAFPARNSAEDLGVYDPEWRVFAETFFPMPTAFKRLLFSGLYASIVFLHNTSPRGGLCTGMARWAIARGQGKEPAPATREAAIERIAVFHGRQLRDRALLSSSLWFLRASPNAAFRAVRRDLLHRGITDRALDIAVPKPWRRDVLSALVQQGHTVVPYRLMQEGTTSGWIEVYDPNHPADIDSEEPRRIIFDLRRNRYSYGSLVTMGQRNVGMIAVGQRAYMGRGTALLATLGSLLFAPRKGMRAMRQQPQHDARA